ncbi:MAG: MarR family winged helix-turn-helix transcriptional regulator [Lautropia sp.]
MPITNVKKMRRSPGFLLRCAHQFSQAIVAEHFTPLNITAIQFASLVAINDLPGLDATRLAALINYDRPTMTGVIDRLEAKGLVMREVAPSDRRARLLFITPEGLRVLAQADQAAHQSRDALLGSLSPDERRQFMHLLEKLVELHMSRDAHGEQMAVNGK